MAERSMSEPVEPRVPRGTQPPRGAPAPPLRPDDVRENVELRGRVVRGGVGAVPAVWEE